MCGITGFLHFDQQRQADKTLLKRMTNTLVHRGPDGEGYFIENNIGLGHRRLSIIDLSTGDQPMSSSDGKLTIVFNGEIYNYIELKDELRGKGFSFHTNSDTEVLLHAYRCWGTDFLNKLNGMWAIALWDSNLKTLLVSRDRMGEKPLFYSMYDNSFIFGSEIKSLLKYGVDPTPNLQLTELYFTLGYVPAPYSLYKNVQKLEAGHYLLISGNTIKNNIYWDLPEIQENRMLADKDFVHNTFNDLFQDSVKIRMRSDVPFGAFLSGGLDSSSIVAVMSEISKEPIKTFTIGFKEKIFDESKLALQVAKKFNTDHYEKYLEQDVFDDSLTKILHHFDEPFGDSSAIPTGNVAKVAVQKVKMVLTGDGGDEVLSGYTGYQGEKFVAKYNHVPEVLRKILPPAINGLAHLTRGSARYQLNRVVKILSAANLPFNDRLMSKLWCSPKFAKEFINTKDQLPLGDFISDFFNKYRVRDPFYRLMFFQLKVLLPDDFLTKVDRMSMAHSLETRIPFLDHRIVEFMIHVHKNVKMNGWERKSVLRETIGKKLPPDLLNAPKKGFVLPLREWFKGKDFEGKLLDLSKDDVGLNQTAIKELVQRNSGGKEDLGNFLWMIFIYRRWLKSNNHY